MKIEIIASRERFAIETPWWGQQEAFSITETRGTIEGPLSDLLRMAETTEPMNLSALTGDDLRGLFFLTSAPQPKTKDDLMNALDPERRRFAIGTASFSLITGMAYASPRNRGRRDTQQWGGMFLLEGELRWGKEGLGLEVGSSAVWSALQYPGEPPPLATPPPADTPGKASE